MLASLKKDFKTLRDGKPGSRFRDFRRYKAHQRSGKKPISRILTFLLGLLLLIGGLAIGWLPGPGGFIAFIGLAFLAREFPGIARIMDMGEVLLRKVYSWFRQLPAWLRIVIGSTCVAFCGGAIWFGFQQLK